jgi:hypothetical protein
MGLSDTQATGVQRRRLRRPTQQSDLQIRLDASFDRRDSKPKTNHPNGMEPCWCKPSNRGKPCFRHQRFNLPIHPFPECRQSKQRPYFRVKIIVIDRSGSPNMSSYFMVHSQGVLLRDGATTVKEISYLASSHALYIKPCRSMPCRGTMPLSARRRRTISASSLSR